MAKTYNCFDDPNEDDADIVRLRDLHAAMDHVVLDVQGSSDIPTDCRFLLDYPNDDDIWARRKKPYHYRWLNSVRNEVLAGLPALNSQRAAKEIGMRTIV